MIASRGASYPVQTVAGDFPIAGEDRYDITNICEVDITQNLRIFRRFTAKVDGKRRPELFDGVRIQDDALSLRSKADGE